MSRKILRIYQVQDIEAKFQALDKLQGNNWVSDEPKVVKKKILKKRPVTKVTGKAGGVPARSRFLEFRAKMKQAQEQPTDDKVEEPEGKTKTFEGGFFCVASPVRSPKPHCEGRYSMMAACGQFIVCWPTILNRPASHRWKFVSCWKLVVDLRDHRQPTIVRHLIYINFEPMVGQQSFNGQPTNFKLVCLYLCCNFKTCLIHCKFMKQRFWNNLR